MRFNMIKKITAILLLISLLGTMNVEAASRMRKDFTGAGFLVAAGMLGLAMMHATCAEASPDMWDMDKKDRTDQFKCKSIFTQFRDFKGLAIYKQDEAEATKRYPKFIKGLIGERVAAGGPPEPPKGCEGHHIVPQKDKRSFALPYADDLRYILKDCNIDIDSVENGVYLPKKGAQNPECEGKFHSDLHNEPYYRQVFDYLNEAKNQNGCSGVKDTLRFIKDNLSAGKL